MKKTIAQQLADKTFQELGIDQTGNPLPSPYSPANSRKPPVDPSNLPFHIPIIKKTTRQAQRTTGYKASASWQTASLLRDLLTLWFNSLPPSTYQNLPLHSRLKGQLLDAARSIVANIEEGWGRPTTKELLDYLGFSQGSLTEVRGDIERCHTDGLLKSGKTMQELGIPTPSRKFPYPPVISRNNPSQYGKLRDKLREFTGKNLQGQDLTYQIFLELINKTDFLVKRSVNGLQQKVITDKKQELNQNLYAIKSRYW